MKTLLFPKNLANEKEGGGLCKTPHAVVLRRCAPPPRGFTFSVVVLVRGGLGAP